MRRKAPTANTNTDTDISDLIRIPTAASLPVPASSSSSSSSSNAVDGAVALPDIDPAVFLPELKSKLQGYLKQVFSRDKSPRLRGMIPQLTTAIMETAAGELWPVVSRRAKIQWADISSAESHHPEVKALYAAARECGGQVRQMIREAAADTRAVEGWLEPVFWKGKRSGTIRKFDSRLLELMLKANNPSKYGEKQTVKHEGSGPGVVYNVFLGPNSGTNPAPIPPKTIEVQEIPSKTEERPEDSESDTHQST